jgi:hypothetical protein
VPVGGLTPYPSEAEGQPDWAAQVVITPVSLLTLGVAGNTSVADKYDAAHATLGVAPKGGLYGKGMLNSDPMAMLASGNPAKVGVGFRSLGAAAKVLTTLSTARALYECRDQDAVRLSNELFHQWAIALLKPDVLSSEAKLAEEFGKLCLAKCGPDAASSLAAIHKQLADLEVGLGFGPSDRQQ